MGQLESTPNHQTNPSYQSKGSGVSGISGLRSLFLTPLCFSTPPFFILTYGFAREMNCLLFLCRGAEDQRPGCVGLGLRRHPGASDWPGFNPRGSKLAYSLSPDAGRPFLNFLPLGVFFPPLATSKKLKCYQGGGSVWAIKGDKTGPRDETTQEGTMRPLWR